MEKSHTDKGCPHKSLQLIFCSRISGSGFGAEYCNCNKVWAVRTKSDCSNDSCDVGSRGSVRDYSSIAQAEYHYGNTLDYHGVSVRNVWTAKSCTACFWNDQ